MTEVSKVLNDSARMDEDQFKEMISRNTFLPDARNSEILFVSDLDDEDEEEFEDEDGDEDEELFDEDEISLSYSPEEKVLALSSDEHDLYTRLIEGDYPPFERVTFVSAGTYSGEGPVTDEGIWLLTGQGLTLQSKFGLLGGTYTISQTDKGTIELSGADPVMKLRRVE